MIMIVPLAAFGEEIQIDTMSHTNADGAIGCGGGGQGSVKITDGDSEKDGQPTSGESGGSSGGSRNFYRFGGYAAGHKIHGSGAMRRTYGGKNFYSVRGSAGRHGR